MSWSWTEFYRFASANSFHRLESLPTQLVAKMGSEDKNPNHLNLQFTEHLQCQTPTRSDTVLRILCSIFVQVLGRLYHYYDYHPILQIRKSKFRGEIYLLCSCACLLLIIKYSLGFFHLHESFLLHMEAV